MKKVIVISLGGSMIIPNKVNTSFLSNFKKIILKNTNKHKFIIVCGGGNTARNYINGIDDNSKNSEYFQSLLGIASTRLNAKFMTYFFQKNINQVIPRDMTEIENLLKKHDIVFCGALRYADKETSDATSAKLANHFKSEFINLTNVAGLYDKDPKKNKNAKFILGITHKDFLKMTEQIKYKPGQHFVLDQEAAKIIKKYNILTYIIGNDSKELDNILNKRYFVGTIIGN